MTQNEIVTKQDLQQAEQRILKGVEQLVANATTKKSATNIPERKYLRTRDVLKYLGISENTLKMMRDKRQIPFTKLGKLLYYPEAEIIAILNNNLIPALPK